MFVLLLLITKFSYSLRESKGGKYSAGTYVICDTMCIDMKKRGRKKITSEKAEKFAEWLDELDQKGAKGEFDPFSDWSRFFYREKLAAERYAFEQASKDIKIGMQKKEERNNQTYKGKPDNDANIICLGHEENMSIYGLDDETKQALLAIDPEKEAKKYLKKQESWAIMLFFPDYARVRQFTKKNVLVRQDPCGQRFFILNAKKEDEYEHPGYKFYREYRYRPDRAFFTNTYDAALFIYSFLNSQERNNKYGFEYKAPKLSVNDFKKILDTTLDAVERHKYESEIKHEVIRKETRSLKSLIEYPRIEKVEKAKNKILEYISEEEDRSFILMHFENLKKTVYEYSYYEIGKKLVEEYRNSDAANDTVFPYIRSDVKKAAKKRRGSVRDFPVVTIGMYPTVKDKYRKEILTDPNDDLNWTLY